MVALIVLPAVAIAVLVTMVYEDRLLPRPESPQEPPAAAEPAATPAPAVAAEPVAAPASQRSAEPADPARGTRPRTRHCNVRQGVAPQVRPRTHRSAAGAVPQRRTPVRSRP